jgi:LmbE family N-acetylglucosaminyl deacetylase
MNFIPKKVLVLAPHTDDGEFGCGATLAKWSAAGSEIHYVAFSSCEQSVPEGFPKDVLVKEVKSATKVLGIEAENLNVLNYEVRKFSSSRQEILEDMVKMRKAISPEVVFMPSFDDFHQDHFAIAQEGLRAFKHSAILCYEVPWNNIRFNALCFSKVDEKHIGTKVKSLEQYKSQAFRNYATEDFIKSLAKVRGVQAGSTYAEAFDVLRWFI